MIHLGLDFYVLNVIEIIIILILIYIVYFYICFTKLGIN